MSDKNLQDLWDESGHDPQLFQAMGAAEVQRRVAQQMATQPQPPTAPEPCPGEEGYLVRDHPEYQCAVDLFPDRAFTISFTRPMPCRWWRFWQWALLGWKWRKLT